MKRQVSKTPGTVPVFPGKIKKLQISDYPSLIEIWKEAGFKIGKSEEKHEVEKFLQTNPKTSLGVYNNDTLIGCILGGYDGRRGLIHHFALRKDYQGKGYGKALLDQLMAIFKEKGVVKVSFWVKKDNTRVIPFYERHGFELRDDLITMSKEL
ncbi:MAG: GNAT family N-acetyltransferase [Thermotogota bacterium]